MENHSLRALPPGHSHACGCLAAVSGRPADWRSALEPLTDELPLAYESCRELVAADVLRRFSLRRCEAVVNNPAASVLLAWRGAGPVGLACWSRLAWDSELFGLPAARLDLLVHGGSYAEAREGKSPLLERVLRRAREAGIRHMTTRVRSGDFSSLHALEGAGFELIDGIQTFARTIEDAPAPANGVRLFREPDLEQIIAIARSAYRLDRFHSDPALADGVADAVHAEWLRGSCAGKVADAVVVAASGDRVLGYVTCKVDRDSADQLGVSIGTIVLVATAEEARGRGIGREATLGALDWFRGQGVSLVEVGTQLRNVPAARLYESCGFRLAGVNLTLRKVL